MPQSMLPLARNQRILLRPSHNQSSNHMHNSHPRASYPLSAHSCRGGVSPPSITTPPTPTQRAGCDDRAPEGEGRPATAVLAPLQPHAPFHAAVARPGRKEGGEGGAGRGGGTGFSLFPPGVRGSRRESL